MRFINHGRAAAIAALVAALPAMALAQTGYPGSGAVYTPNAQLPAQTLSGTGNSSAFQVNGVGTMYVRIAGTNSGLAATVQISESRGTSPTWTSTAVDKTGVGRVQAITGNGLYRVNVSGALQARVNVSALGSGTVVVTMSAGAGDNTVAALGIGRQTYSYAMRALTPAASATDFFTITGSATRTVRVLRVSCDGVATATAANPVVALKRSTANTAGTSAAVTAASRDSLNDAATATALSYTANPTTGTLVANLKAGLLVLNIAATTTLASSPLVFDFSQPDAQPVVLRGITEVFALNGAGASFAAGASINCNADTTEE